LNQILDLKEENSGFQTEFEVLTPTALPEDIEAQYQTYQAEIDALAPEIDRLTNHADGIDYAAAVSCGLVTGFVDTLWSGAEWDFKGAKAWSNRSVNEMVQTFAKKDPGFATFCEYTEKGNLRAKPKDRNRLDTAIEFLEKKYKLPGDNEWNLKNNLIKTAKEHGFAGKKYEEALQYMNVHVPKAGGWAVEKMHISASSHHLDDFCHHPTIGGLLSCICVQFTGNAIYHSGDALSVVQVPVAVNEYGSLVGSNGAWKLFSGVINWFFCVAQTAQNRRGHLMSDISGTSSAAKNQRGGAGVPGSFLSMADELSTLPCFQDAEFSKNLHKAYMKGIGTGKGQVDLGVLNSLFEGASSKMDVRTERAVGHELGRQAIPVLVNTVLVRAIYFIRRFIRQMREKKSVLELDWSELFPANNRTIIRMLTIASGTFMAVDLVDAAIRAAASSGGNAAAFAPNLILRVNFVGIGRFVLAIGADVGMGLRRGSLNQRRLKLYEQQLALMLDTRVYYRVDTAWVAVERAEQIVSDMEKITQRNVSKYLTAVSGQVAATAKASGVTLRQIGSREPARRAALQRISGSNEKIQKQQKEMEQSMRQVGQRLEELL